MKDKSHEKIMQALAEQKEHLRNIDRRQSWWLDLSSNVAGNAIFDGAVWVVRRLLKRG